MGRLADQTRPRPGPRAVIHGRRLNNPTSQAIAEGKVISLSRDVIHDILRPDCDYQKLMIASEQPGSRLRFVTRYELGPRGGPLDYKIGIPR